MSFTNLEPGTSLIRQKVITVLDKGDRDPQFGGDPAEIEISLVVGDDGAVLVWIDTVNFEPDGTKLRVNVNDGPVFGYQGVVGI